MMIAARVVVMIRPPAAIPSRMAIIEPARRYTARGCPRPCPSRSCELIDHSTFNQYAVIAPPTTTSPT